MNKLALNSRIKKFLAKQALKKAVSEKFDLISDIKNLNCVGCLFAAYGVYLSLQKDKHDMSNVCIIQLSSWAEEDIEANKSFLEGNSQNAVSSSHFALSVDGGKTFLDSDGILTRDYNYHLVIPSAQVDAFSKSALKYGSWNSMFDREKNVPKINKVLVVDMKY